jgi:hypothetical protein
VLVAAVMVLAQVQVDWERISLVVVGVVLVGTAAEQIMVVEAVLALL